VLAVAGAGIVFCQAVALGATVVRRVLKFIRAALMIAKSKGSLKFANRRRCVVNEMVAKPMAKRPPMRLLSASINKLLAAKLNCYYVPNLSICRPVGIMLSACMRPVLFC
jgi:hypothetical protein